MSTVTLDEPTHEKLRLVAATLGVTEAAAVAELLRRLAVPPATATGDPKRVPIHVVYKGTRVDAEFDSVTQAVTIVSPPLDGKTFTSPSRAAIEVVSLLNPKVSPNRNGWDFWIVDSTGEPLDSIRRGRR